MSKGTLFDKVWEEHKVGELPTGQTQLFVGRHLVHEVTSPPAFDDIRENGLKVKHPELTFATLDHVIPTCDASRPFKDKQAELMTKTLEDNVKEFDITYFGPGSGKNGVCHVTFPEQGIILPGMVVVCGDSHTCTHGAVGTVSFGIGTTQVGHTFATQTVAMDKLKVKRINFSGKLQRGVTAKDVALNMIRLLGVKGGVGFAYEFGGETVYDMGMEDRMTLCNIAAVEAGARCGYVNPDEVTFEYLRGREFAPKEDFDRAIEYWKSFASDADAQYDGIVEIDVSNLEPMVTWGVNPEQCIGISERVPYLKEFKGKAREEAKDAMEYMGLEPGQKIIGVPISKAFTGSCTEGRKSNFRNSAEIQEGRENAVEHLVVPGSEKIKYDVEQEGWDKIFRDAGASWRNPGCSMCLAMNPDKLVGQERSASTSNRNFKGRQGSPTGRTHLMSAYTVGASAIEGKIADPRKYLEESK